jgi:hypothetical protein
MRAYMYLNQISDVTCIICNKKVELPRLREHIGVHIILRDLINNANTGFGTNVTRSVYCRYTAEKSKPKKRVEIIQLNVNCVI